MCQNTQRPNLCACNPQWHNPITQPVIGPFQSVQPGSGAVSPSQHSSLSGGWKALLISHPLPPLSSLTSPARRPPLGPSPSPRSAIPPSLPLFLPASRCHGRSFLSGQQKSLFSSLLSTVMTRLPIHLLRRSSSSTQCNYRPHISKWTKWRSVSDQRPGSNTNLP